MIINKVKIHNFKLIDDFTFNPKMINIFLGRNNSGKTSLLQSISLSFNDYIIVEDHYIDHPINLIRYGSNEGYIEINIKYSIKQHKISLKVPDIDAILKKLNDDALSILKNAILLSERHLTRAHEEINRFKSKFTKEIINYLLELNQHQEALINATKDCVEFTRDDKSRIICGIEYNQLLSNLMTYCVNKTDNIKIKSLPALSDYLMITADRFSRNLHGIQTHLVEERKKEKNKGVVSFIKPYTELNDKNNFTEVNAHKIEDIIKKDNLYPGLLRFNFNKIVIKGIDTDVNIDTMGDGFKALIGTLLGIVKEPENSILLLEEPEVHMHPAYIRKIVKNIVNISINNKIQFFISTHSMDFIDNFLIEENFSNPENEFLRRQLCIVRQNRNNDALLSETIDYDTAINDVEDLKLDLRGI